MIQLLDWVYPIGNKTKTYSVREVIGDKLALTAPDYTRLYLGMSEVEKITAVGSSFIASYRLYIL